MEDRYLFKAKHFKEWHIGNIVKEPDGLYIRDINKNVMAYINDESTICQCTGLKDKKGKLIWENDIIKTFDAGEEWGLSKIIFADTSLGYGWKTTDIKSLSKYNNNLFKEVSFGSFDSKSVEIVGNIFDNAELLESEG